MPELHDAGPPRRHGPGDDSALPDAELGERIRSGAPRAHPALRELKRRHLPAVLAYARLCGRNQTAGDQLAVQALRRASEEACRGIEPRGHWRHHLLTLVRGVGVDWARGGRRDRLSPGFAAWIDADSGTVSAAGAVTGEPTAGGSLPSAGGSLPSTGGSGPPAGGSGPPEDGSGPPEDGSASEASAAVLDAFYRLPALTRGVLWYAVVDQEPDATVAAYLGVRGDLVPDLRDRARESIRQAFLRTYLERGDERCLGFRRIIDAATRPVDGRRSEDLELHLAGCARCARAVAELTRMADDPRTVLAGHLLGWGGAEYTTRLPVSGTLGDLPVPDSVPGPALVPSPGSGQRSANGTAAGAVPGRPGLAAAGAALERSTRRPLRSVLLIAGAVVVLAGSAAAGAALVAFSGDPGASREPAAAAPAPTAESAFPTFGAPPPVPTRTASPGGRPSARPSPSPTRTRPPAATEPSAPAPTKDAVPVPVPIVPGTRYHPVVNAATGGCLDVEDGVMADRTDVITTTCNGATTQQWRLEPNGLLRNGADPDFCLDSRGDTDRGAGIWSCSSVDGRNGLNLRFGVDGAGVVHPLIAPHFALEPRGGSLGFDRLDNGTDQRWNAGTRR
ncbi:RICIN domain-containing protein [Streptomyces tirandamycinicus]|uniref:RICIN domain-containing protein n=1 Tax=Streptomyces tirandamycinicus TaxID=2174846 RepID=UPI003421BEE1